jgi:hypothetical protein
MDKSKHFFGNSVFGQLISLIDPNIISESAKTCNSDRYIKKFTTKDHLISMLFCAFAKCISLRELSGGDARVYQAKQNIFNLYQCDL